MSAGGEEKARGGGKMRGWTMREVVERGRSARPREGKKGRGA